MAKGPAIRGWLDLSGTGVTSLPADLSVSGDLNLSGTGITEFPDGLAIGNSLSRRASARSGGTPSAAVPA